MIRFRNVIVSCIILTVIGAPNIHADVIIENFTYIDQEDVSEPHYRITTDGSVGGPGVIEFSEGLASGASLAAGVVFFTTNSATGFSGEFVGIGDIPGSATTVGGSFGDFFSSPQNLSSAFGSIDVAHTAGGNATRFRLLAEDNSGNEVATSDFTLNSTLTTYSFASGDFVIEVTGNPMEFDDENVTNVGIEFFATPNSGAVDELTFQIDNFQLTSIPEPGSMVVLLGVGAMLTLRRRRF